MDCEYCHRRLPTAEDNLCDKCREFLRENPNRIWLRPCGLIWTNVKNVSHTQDVQYVRADHYALTKFLGAKPISKLQGKEEEHVHAISIRASNQWRPVVEYEFYCRNCKASIEKIFTLEMIPPDLRRSQLILTAAKFVGMDKAEVWGRSQKCNEFFRTDFAQVVREALPQPAVVEQTPTFEARKAADDKEKDARLLGKFPPLERKHDD